jgi:hypothetical protein
VSLYDATVLLESTTVARWLVHLTTYLDRSIDVVKEKILLKGSGSWHN